MKYFLNLSINDLRSTFRDPVFKALLFFPFVSYAIVGWIFPAVIHRWPVIGDYADVILMWACMQSSTMFGFIYGFLFLEEREEHITDALQVVPVRLITMIFARLLAGMLVSFMVNFVLFHFGGIAHLQVIQEILLALLYSLSAPLITLLVTAFAGNRIEGLAQMKIFNILLILPGLIFFLPYPLLNITAIIPTYWSFRATEMALKGSPLFPVYLAGGLIFHLGLIFFLNRYFDKKLHMG